MGALTLAAIAAAMPPAEKVEVPEWGGYVMVRTMTAGERDAFLASVVSKGQVDSSAYRLKQALACVVDDDGAPIFPDLEALKTKASAPGFERVSQVVDRLNTVSAETVDAAEKNSAGVTSDSSSAVGL